MDITLKSPEFGGCVDSICSKSQAHRALICAYLAKGKSRIFCPYLNADIKATADCLKNMGAKITYENGYFEITPPDDIYDLAEIDCGESGSTLRFLIPVAAISGRKTIFNMHGRLSERPIFPLTIELEKYGVKFSGKNPLICENILQTGCDFEIAANASSQFASGLMFAIGAFGGSLKLIGNVESKPYIDMTMAMLNNFGAQITECDNIYSSPKKQGLTANDMIIEGDWSNAAFFLAMGAVGKNAITVKGLDVGSKQGDKAILDILKDMGTKFSVDDNSVTVYPSALRAACINAKDIPDLVPILSVCASCAMGTTKISGVSRLRLKESDRIKTVCDMIATLGGKINLSNDDCLEITGCKLCGGVVDSCNDHRIAMSAAVASTICKSDVTIKDAMATDKSYPTFWEEIEKLTI
ncbi:MAG: 3-phosphoshikimate 1-carboxyvinyltransferase [Oscillospiraceae bacterium]|nr:3-phosphoshikimate 1-carboxyvinyltransferase [Oscillospiraceae bacterium]